MTAPDPTPRSPARRRAGAGPRRVVVAAVALLAVAAGSMGTAAAQDPSSTTSSSTSTTVAPGAPPATSTPASPTPTEPAADAPVPVPDVASIDQLVADARVQAQALRTSQIATARAAVEAADVRVAEVTARLATAEAKATLAGQATKVMQGQVETWRERISAFAADAYMRVGTNQDETLTRIEGGADRASADRHGDARRTTIYADKAVGAARRERAAAAERLATARRDQRAAEAAAEAVDEELRTVSALRESASSVESTLRTTPLQVSTDSIVKGLSGPKGPTILGPSLLSAADLAGFSRDRGGVAPSVDIDALAAAFIDEGNAEGVRADLAWAQSVIETGNFGFVGSMVSPDDHNYAGIGACDSCSSGFRYDTPQLGARAQIQLLRTYADPTITARSLARPPVGKAPESVGVRGCCSTWMALSGRWATGPGYGIKILTVYNQMLQYAAARRVAAQAAPAVPAPAGP